MTLLLCDGMTAVIQRLGSSEAVDGKNDSLITAGSERSSLPATVFGGVTTLLGIVVLAGWYTGNDLLKSVLPGHIIMLPNTAVCFLAGGFSLWLQRSESETLPAPVTSQIRIARGLGFLVMFVVGFTLATLLPARPRDLRNLTLWTQEPEERGQKSEVGGSRASSL